MLGKKTLRRVVRDVRMTTQGCCGCSITAGVQDQFGWISEQPGLVEGAPVPCRGVGIIYPLKSLPT